MNNFKVTDENRLTLVPIFVDYLMYISTALPRAGKAIN